MRNDLVNIDIGSLRRATGSPARLSYEAARQSPCADCAESPCCTHLPLQSFPIRTLMELDNAAYLLNFDHIELALASTGDWSVYYACACRFLNPATYGCTLHGTPEQPDICVNYNPYQCFYKRAFRGDASHDVIRIDRARLERFTALVGFDEDRNICDVPDWETLSRELGAIPLSDVLAGPGTVPAEEPSAARQQPAVPFHPADPCEGCGAWCCKSLIFPQSVPATASQMDYFKFCLGFPGVQLGISDEGWALLVLTTCQHLAGNRCGVYGLPERPLRCRYYSAQSCSYKPIFAAERPGNLLRIGLSDLPAVMSLMSFDALGKIVEMPPVARLRGRIEEGLQA